MRRKPQVELALRALRSALLVAILTVGSLSLIKGDPIHPRGNPLLYAIGLSWLIALIFAMTIGVVISRANLSLFCLARWEKEGEIYRRTGVREFRWVLLHSPLGWINPSLHLRAGRADCDRLQREMNTSETVHWLTCAVSIALAIRYFSGNYAVYGYAMLLVRIPFDLYPILLQRWNRGRVCRVLSRHPTGSRST